MRPPCRAANERDISRASTQDGVDELDVDGHWDAGRHVGGAVDASAQADGAGQHTAPQLLSKAAAEGWRGAQEQSMPQETTEGDGLD